MSGAEFANGHKAKAITNRVKIPLHKKLKVKNRRLVEIIKNERLERAALLERIQLHEEALSKSKLELAVLKAQLAAVKSALTETSNIMDEGINSFRLAKIRCLELQDEIDNSSANPTAMEEDPDNLNCHQTTSASATSNLVLAPPPKLQARVNPMVQGVPLMCPSIMLQRLQPEELERQMSSSIRGVTATTPISPNVHEASVPLLTEESQTSQHDESVSPGGSTELQESSSPLPGNSDAQRDPADSVTLRRSARLRRQ